MKYVLSLVLLLVCRPAAGAGGPVADTLRAGLPLATFDDARALAVDPFGWLYVADAGRGVVLRLASSGLVAATLGGPGSGEGEFDTPSDVDPTNGLVLLVADAGNARIQRFSRELAYLGSYTAGRPDGAAGGGLSSGRRNDTGATVPEGRPVAVASPRAGEVFAADADRHVVLRWDPQGRRVEVVGDQAAGAGALVEPVALAVDGQRSVFVADRGRRAVVVFDVFGGYVRTLGEGRLDDVRGLVVHDGRLWIVQPERLLVYTLDGRMERVVAVALNAPLVDVAFHPDGLYLLTAGALYRAL